VADDYVDTGNLTADHAWHLGLEALWNEGPFSVLAEYNRAWVSSAASGNPQFSGYYITASWILTGETRPYDRTVGYARRVMPAGRWGAPELVARFRMWTLTTRGPGRPVQQDLSCINWWARGAGKLLRWGHTWLDRFWHDRRDGQFSKRASNGFIDHRTTSMSNPKNKKPATQKSPARFATSAMRWLIAAVVVVAGAITFVKFRRHGFIFRFANRAEAGSCGGFHPSRRPCPTKRRPCARAGGHV